MKIIQNLFMMLLALVLIVSCSTSNNKQEETLKKMDEKAKGTETITERPQYVISVSVGNKPLGDIEIELFPDVAPKHVANFDSLVSVKFYDGTAFHRVIPGFMIQGGDPNSKDKPQETWGFGSPDQTRVPAEFNKTKHVRGIISAARSQDPNSATSQFFIMHGNAPHLDGQYTAYGQVTKGLEVVDEVCKLPLGGPQGSAPAEKVSMKIVKK